MIDELFEMKKGRLEFMKVRRYNIYLPPLYIKMLISVLRLNSACLLLTELKRPYLETQNIYNETEWDK